MRAILVMVATAAMGSGLGPAGEAEVPTLPCAAQSRSWPCRHVGVPCGEVDRRWESVTIGADGLTISLETGRCWATSLSGNLSGRGPRINLVGPPPDVRSGAVADLISSAEEGGVRLDSRSLKGGSPLMKKGDWRSSRPWIAGSGRHRARIIDSLGASDGPRARRPPRFVSRVKGELTELKTRGARVVLKNDIFRSRWTSEHPDKDRGWMLDAPMRERACSARAQLEIQLRGEAARTGALDVIETQLLRPTQWVPKVHESSAGRRLQRWARLSR